MKYALTYRKSVKKDVKILPKSILLRIERVILALRINPYPNNATKLKGYINHYRVRYSSYRIIYAIHKEKKQIRILKIGHRKDIYVKMNS